MTLKFAKRLNNNVVLATDENGNDVVLFGRGLGFGMQVGSQVDSARVEKVYSLRDNSANRKLHALLETVAVDYLETAEDIHRFASANLSTPLTDSLMVHLADHIHMAVTRARQGVEVRNMMLQEIRRFYKDEFQVGTYAIAQMNERFGTNLGEDEAGFVALHVVNAQLAAGDQNASLTKITEVIQDIERIVRLHYGTEIDTSSNHYRRFVTHLKFFADRIFQDQVHRGGDVSRMLETVKDTYPGASECVEQIEMFLHRKYNHKMSEDEHLYLTIHVAHITR